MFFFCKKKEVVLDCFTASEQVHQFAKISPATKYYPEWWKQTPKWNDNVNMPTIKNCVAFADFYSKGIVIPSWFDVNLKIHKKSDPHFISWKVSNSPFKGDNCHPKEQFEKFSLGNANNFKISSPWRFRTKDEIYFTWTQPTWSQRDLIPNLTILPGVINFRYQFATEINFMIINEDNFDKEVRIFPLTPLVILHPMTDKKVIVRNHLIDDKELDKIFGHHTNMFWTEGGNKDSFYPTAYNRRKKFIKKIEEIGDCPFKKYD